MCWRPLYFILNVQIVCLNLFYSLKLPHIFLNLFFHLVAIFFLTLKNKVFKDKLMIDLGAITLD